MLIFTLLARHFAILAFLSIVYREDLHGNSQPIITEKLNFYLGFNQLRLLFLFHQLLLNLFLDYVGIEIL